MNAHKRQWMAVLLEKDLAVGFAICWELEFQIRLDIFSLRCPGEGRVLENIS